MERVRWLYLIWLPSDIDTNVYGLFVVSSIFAITEIDMRDTALSSSFSRVLTFHGASCIFDFCLQLVRAHFTTYSSRVFAMLVLLLSYNIACSWWQESSFLLSVDVTFSSLGMPCQCNKNFSIFVTWRLSLTSISSRLRTKQGKWNRYDHNNNFLSPILSTTY